VNEFIYKEQTTQEQICSPVNTFYVMYSNAEKTPEQVTGVFLVF
jgi:hypothetical protein